MNVGSIRGFLLQAPKPALVRVHTCEGETKDIRAKNYQKTSETIAALDPELIECLDKDGHLIRARRVGGSNANPSDDPPLPKALEDDPTAAAFSLYAKLLAKAYEHSTEVAFGKMVELVERMGERSDSIEQRLERAEAAHRRAVEERIADEYERVAEVAERAAEAADGGGLEANLMSTFLAGAMQQPKPPTKAAPAKPSNGKGHD